MEKTGGDTYRRAIEETVYPGSGMITIIAMDISALNATAAVVNGSSVYQSHVSGLYGVGSTTSILNEMDKGVIKGLAVYSQFDEGYLSVKRAVEAIQGNWQRSQLQLDSFYIEKGDLRNSSYEKMLYPVE